ncbi:unnamed protein product, partial [Lymnaea stagnalis]
LALTLSFTFTAKWILCFKLSRKLFIINMSEVYPAEPSSGSPSKPDNVRLVPDIPEEEASSALIEDEEISDFDCTGPSPNINSNNNVNDDMVDPSKIITDEMLQEEMRLYSSGSKEEEKRLEEEARLIEEMTDQSRDLKYERLKFLLSKSTMYTEYLVGRIKVQKEEEEKRKARMQKMKLKKEEQEKDLARNHESVTAKEKAGINNTQGNSRQKRGINKRNDDDKGDPPTKSKRQKKNATSPSGNAQSSGGQEGSCMYLDDKKAPADNNCALKTDEERTALEEPELKEKALTFGIDEVEEKRVINGEEVSFLQPKLMEGGVLRPYQIEGYSWLKVLYENGVNGILADEMGLGKTVQCVAILSHLIYMGIAGPFLICAPLSTIPNWFAEFQRFAPKVPTLLYHGTKDSRTQLRKTMHRRFKIREGVFVQPVVITSYEMVMIDRKTLANYDWKYLIVDEGHRIKNTQCRLIRDLRMYRSTHRLLLTGTPLQNNLSELWSLLNFLLPEIFDDLGSFESWFDINFINGVESNEKIVHQEQSNNILSMLHQILSPFMLRRLKSDVDLKIPPKKEIIVYAPLTQLQKDFYTAVVDKSIFSYIEKDDVVEEEKVEKNLSGRPKRSTCRKVNYELMMESEIKKSNVSSHANKRGVKGVEEDLEREEMELESWVYSMNDNFSSTTKDKVIKQKTSQTSIKLRNIMMQLRKVCNHPYLLEHPLDPKTGDLAITESLVKESGKMLILDRMLKELKKRGHKVLIFSQMTRMLDLIEDFCYLRGYDFCRLDGSTLLDDRKDGMTAFNDASCKKFLFLLSTRAGGLGINLIGADTVILYDSDWNPQCDLQAQDRCHRIGQTKPVVVYRFVAANTIDQKIIERASAKRKLEKMVIHKGKFKKGNFMSKSKPISSEELRDLLQSKDHDVEVHGTDFVINDADLESLLDRSDLYEKWQ